MKLVIFRLQLGIYVLQTDGAALELRLVWTGTKRALKNLIKLAGANGLLQNAGFQRRGPGFDCNLVDMALLPDAPRLLPRLPPAFLELKLQRLHPSGIAVLYHRAANLQRGIGVGRRGTVNCRMTVAGEQ